MSYHNEEIGEALGADVEPAPTEPGHYSGDEDGCNFFTHPSPLTTAQEVSLIEREQAKINVKAPCIHCHKTALEHEGGYCGGTRSSIFSPEPAQVTDETVIADLPCGAWDNESAEYDYPDIQIARLSEPYRTQLLTYESIRAELDATKEKLKETNKLAEDRGARLTDSEVQLGKQMVLVNKLKKMLHFKKLKTL